MSDTDNAPARGRIGEPEDVANAIAALCSIDSEWINGQLVFANGGFF